MHDPGDAKQGDEQGDEAVVVEDVALRAVKVAVPHRQGDGGGKPAEYGGGVGEKRPPAPFFIGIRHGFAAVRPDFQGCRADLQQGVTVEGAGAANARAVGMAFAEAADGEALAGFFDDDVVVSDKRAFDGDVVVRAATNTHGVVVDAVDVVGGFDGQFACHVICSSRCAMTRLPRFSWMPVSIMVMVKPCCFSPICAAIR